MSKSVAVIVAVALALLLAACKGGGGDTSNLKANIRFVHVSPDTDAVNIIYDSATVVTSLGYHGATPYQALDWGSKEVKVQSAATGATYSDATISPTFQGYYTYLLFGGGSSMSTLLMSDSVADADSGKFYLRAANVATGIGSVDIYLLSAGTTIDQLVDADGVSVVVHADLHDCPPDHPVLPGVARLPLRSRVRTARW